MCFSATASFTASAVLFICGIAALSRAKTNQRLFAMTPLLFAIQQFIEGNIWQSLITNQPTQLGVYAYLTFVYIVWPSWPALAIMQMSSKASDKINLYLPLMAGIIVSCIAATWFIVETPQATIACRNIVYHANFPQWLWLPSNALYLFATLAPFFISSIPHMWIIGTALALSYAVTMLFYQVALTSVWCFFAALLSIFIFIILK